MDALSQAIAAVGGTSRLAELVGVSSSAPSMWKSRGRVPADYCPAIERATAGTVRCEDLRPDVDWAYLRQSAAAAPTPTPAGEVA
ncbi:helix-turn-helix domain-containing protein [Pigmentiphaga sp. GD03639]|uniref:transcriptional regulator n=1 Tax=Pigmentiphaga sp. GD03639 TaxID=2975354 RepID=UPI00244872AA|nr:helix-turn-helix domain-containing protein [Pigmentiphaga sp. GD03639]MDH2239096.1 helix-turn-helix domain-containing protein [Pigmentiphaga sp. GD03639]